MKYRYLIAGVVFILLSVELVLSFSPPPPNQQTIDLCRSTNGTANITYIKPDCGPDCDAAPSIITGCNCPSNRVWNSSLGCIQKPVESQNILIEIINSLIDFIYRLFGLK